MIDAEKASDEATIVKIDNCYETTYDLTKQTIVTRDVGGENKYWSRYSFKTLTFEERWLVSDWFEFEST